MESNFNLENSEKFVTSETDYIVYKLESGMYYIAYPGEKLDYNLLFKIFRVQGIQYILECPYSSENTMNILRKMILEFGLSHVRNNRYDSILLNFNDWYNLVKFIEEDRYGSNENEIGNSGIHKDHTSCIQCGAKDHLFIDCIKNRYRSSKCYICYRPDHTMNECNYKIDINSDKISNKKKCSVCGKDTHSYFRCSEKYNIFGHRMKRSLYSVGIGKLKTIKSNLINKTD